MSEYPVLQFGFGSIRHKRVWPRVNAFAVGGVFVRLPMRSLAAHSPQRVGGLFGVNRWAPLGFADKDHLNRDATHGSALAAIDEILNTHGLIHCTGAWAGEVWLHTFPRVLGYAFKPVSFWYCHDNNKVLHAIVAEVHNTFGEQHCYLLRNSDGTPLRMGQAVQAEKVFHVSPFFAVRGHYTFRWWVGERNGVSQSVMRIDYLDALHGAMPGTVSLSTSISGAHVCVSWQSCLRALLGYPFHAFVVVARIHYQALKLLFKGAAFHRLPNKPRTRVTASR